MWVKIHIPDRTTIWARVIPLLSNSWIRLVAFARGEGKLVKFTSSTLETVPSLRPPGTFHPKPPAYSSNIHLFFRLKFQIEIEEHHIDEWEVAFYISKVIKHTSMTTSRVAYCRTSEHDTTPGQAFSTASFAAFSASNPCKLALLRDDRSVLFPFRSKEQSHPWRDHNRSSYQALEESSAVVLNMLNAQFENIPCTQMILGKLGNTKY